ncbi:MAG: hypothetical protein WCX16_01860 [Candidatus Omnitrophota bacterium]
MVRIKKGGQSLGEYTVTISLVILAIMGMTYLMQRGFAARINSSRGYMLDTLNPDIEQIRFDRGGYNPSKAVLAEYEPYYVDKISDLNSNPEKNIFINGIADAYSLRSRTVTIINSVSTELPAEDVPVGEQ